ncbi:MAG: acyl-CoA thioesterase [Myxococcales bacterium]|nr:acyl-CoA thioesterase [Myxococcales bacterium]
MPTAKPVPFKAVMPIRFADVDHARILYYPRFFHLFHQAFEDFFNDHLEQPYAHVLGVEKVGFPAVHAEADYYFPLRFGDVAEVELTIEKIGTKSATIVYSVRREVNQTLCCRGQVVVVSINMDTLEGMPIPDKYRQLFEEYKAATDAQATREP